MNYNTEENKQIGKRISELRNRYHRLRGPDPPNKLAFGRLQPLNHYNLLNIKYHKHVLVLLSKQTDWVELN